jgi:HflK protein
LAAIATAVAAGLLSSWQPAEADAAPGSDLQPHGHPRDPDEKPKSLREALVSRLRTTVRYGFVTLLDDLAFWLVLGFAVTGVLAAALPAGFFSRFLSNGFLSLVVMAALGMPTYVCASASTPVVAAMVAKGLNPGAALVFMLTGPATNASTLGIVARLFGRRFMLTYLGAIFGVAIAAGAVVNMLVGSTWTPAVISTGSDAWAWVQSASGLALIVLMVRSLKRTGLRPGLEELRGHFGALAGWLRGAPTSLPWRAILRIAVPLMLALYVSRGLVVVGPGEEGLARAFGRAQPSRLPPGLHLYWPPPIGRVDLVAASAVRTVEIGYMSVPGQGPRSALPASFPSMLPMFGGGRTSRIPEGSLFVTGDETLVAVTAVVEFRVTDPARYRFGVDRPEALLRAVARATLVEAIARTPIDAIYSSARGQVEAYVLAQLRASATVTAMGIRPVSFNLLYVHAPDEVHAAFRDVASAAEDRTTTRNKALVEAEGSVRLARGEAAQRVFQAESYRLEQVERARGNAAGFVPLALEDRRASAVTRDRLYLEAMERVLGRAPKLIKPDPRKASGLEVWITPPDGDRAAPAQGFGLPAGIPPLLPQDDEAARAPPPTPPPQ